MDTPQIEGDDSNNQKKLSVEINEKNREAILNEILQEADEIKKISDEMLKFRKENYTWDYCAYRAQLHQEHERAREEDNQEHNKGQKH